MTVADRLLLLDGGADRDRPGASEEIDRAMYLLSRSGDDGRLWIAIALAHAMLRRRSWGWTLRTLIWLGVESAVVNLGLKRVFRRDRPVCDRRHPSSFRVPTDTSFPSGHAASAAHMAVMLSGSTPAAVTWGALAAAIGASRVRLKVHHTSDVLCGFAVGALFGAVARATDGRRATGTASCRGGT